jgi:hypothetical protein
VGTLGFLVQGIFGGKRGAASLEVQSLKLFPGSREWIAARHSGALDDFARLRHTRQEDL